MAAEAVYDEASGDVTVTGHHSSADADRAAAACAGEHGRIPGPALADRGRLTYPTTPGPQPST